MSALSLETESIGFGSQARRGAFEDVAVGSHEYTRRHRTAWPLLVRETASETLLPRKLKSWVRLWGRLGAELFDRVWFGDGFVRSDMILLARREGGPHGAVVARKLDQCRQQPRADVRIVALERGMKSSRDARGGTDSSPMTFDELAEKLKRRFDRLNDVRRQMEKELEEWGSRLNETERRRSNDCWRLRRPNHGGRRT